MSAAEINSAYASNQKAAQGLPKETPATLEQHAPTPPGTGKTRDSGSGRPPSRKASSQGAQGGSGRGSGRGSGAGGEHSGKSVDKDKPWFVDAAPSAGGN